MAALKQLWNSMRDAGRPAPYLLIDCAGLERGRSQIPDPIFSQLECLFTGDLARELADVGPYLGRLRSYDRTVLDSAEELLLAQVASVAIVQEGAEGGPTFAQVHRHFRKLNVVYGPQGQPLFFRYYDPRVIADVLSVLDAKQLEAFFGGLESLLFTDPDGNVVRCSRRGGELSIERSKEAQS